MKTPYPWQTEHIGEALNAPGHRWLFGDEMGLGKTGQIIETCKVLNPDRILVICPALARQTWAIELAAWWPAQFGPGNENKVGVIYANPERKSLSKAKRAGLQAALEAPVRVVSPELLCDAREQAFIQSVNGSRIDGQGGPRSGHTVVILDEVHYFVNADTGRSKSVDEILSGFDGPILGASATPIPNRIIGLWNVLNIIWKGRFGYRRSGHPVPYQFLDAYSEKIYNGRGTTWGGLRPDRADELKERLSSLMSRTTRKEVKQRWPGILPACQLRPIPLERGRKGNDCVEEWIKGALQEANHVAILTNLRATAADIATLLAATDLGHGVQILHVDGSTPPEERNNKIKLLRQSEKGVLVTTMHAVCEAISLSWCHRALFAELYWRPKTLVQTVGRFPRLDGDTDIIIDVMCGADTVQAKMAISISDKLMDQQKILATGAADEGLVGALSPSNMEDELLAAALSGAGSNWDPDFDKGMDDE